MAKKNKEDQVDPVVGAVSAQLPDVTTEQVAMVLDAWNKVAEGDPLGTILLDPETGATAVRVSDGGVHKWRVTGSDGATWADMQPKLAGWTVVHTP